MKLDIVLAQPNYRVGPVHMNNWYLPYTTGCLWAHTEHGSLRDHLNLVGWVWNRPIIEDQIEKWQNVDVLFCSLYLWNENYCKLFSKAVKDKWPDCLVIWGGPSCDHSNDSFFESYPYVDAVAVSEGEVTFHDLCSKLVAGESIDDVESLVINKNQKCKRNPKRPRTQLGDLPSPYLSEVFDQIIQDNPDVLWSATLETNRGCPYSCTYCDWGGLTASKITQFGLNKVKAEVDWFIKNKISFITMADANFGIFKARDVEIAEFIANIKQVDPSFHGVTICFLKNKTDAIIEIAKILGDVLVNGVALSVQTLDPHVLTHIKRSNMEINGVGDLKQKLDDNGLEYHTELILGMPGETLDSWKKGFWKLYDVGIHNGLRVYPLICAINTEMHRQKDSHEFQIKMIRGIDQDNHITEYFPTVTGSKYMSYDDYLNAWAFTKKQFILHSSGYSQSAAVACKKQGIEYGTFYDILENKLSRYEQWNKTNNDVMHLLDSTYNGKKEGKAEREIESAIHKSVLHLRDVIFTCVEDTLNHFQIENNANIIRHAKALVFDPLRPTHWPMTVDNKKYFYNGVDFKNTQEFVDIYAYRSTFTYTKVEEIMLNEQAV